MTTFLIIFLVMSLTLNILQYLSYQKSTKDPKAVQSAMKKLVKSMESMNKTILDIRKELGV